MSRFSAVTLDLSRFPAPLAIRGIDYEGIMAARKVRLGELFTAAGVDYDVAMLATDPAIIIEESDTYRELLAYAAINDAVRSVMVAFAVGADLEHLAAFYGLSRRVLDPATGAMEGDAELRRRVLLAPEAFATAGTHGGYLFHALTADPGVINADVWADPAAGTAHVAIQARDGLAGASEELVERVRVHLARKDIKPLTDIISVRSVTTHEYAISVIVYAQPGPDQVAVKTLVEDSLAAMAASRRIPARDVPVSAVTAAATVGPVDRVVVESPLADVIMGNGELAVCTGIEVEVRSHDG